MQNHFELKNESNQFGGPASCYAAFLLLLLFALVSLRFFSTLAHTVSQFQQEQQKKIFNKNLDAMALCVYLVFACECVCVLYVASLIPFAFLMSQ